MARVPREKSKLTTRPFDAPSTELGASEGGSEASDQSTAYLHTKLRQRLEVSIYLSICLCIYRLSIYLSIYLSICLSIYRERVIKRQSIIKNLVISCWALVQYQPCQPRERWSTHSLRTSSEGRVW